MTNKGKITQERTVSVFVCAATESSVPDSSLQADVITPEDAAMAESAAPDAPPAGPAPPPPVTNGDLSGSEHADTSGHGEEATYEPVSVGAQVSRLRVGLLPQQQMLLGFVRTTVVRDVWQNPLGNLGCSCRQNFAQLLCVVCA